MPILRGTALPDSVVTVRKMSGLSQANQSEVFERSAATGPDGDWKLSLPSALGTDYYEVIEPREGQKSRTSRVHLPEEGGPYDIVDLSSANFVPAPAQTMGARGPQGPPGDLHLAGSWNGETEYSRGAVVIHDNKAWMHSGVGDGSHEPGGSSTVVQAVEAATHPWAAEQSTANGSKLRNFSQFGGKIYAGYGDWGANTGPIALAYYDHETDQWVSEASLNGEGATRYYVFDDGEKVFVPAIDSRESGVPGNQRHDLARKFADGPWMFTGTHDPEPQGLNATHIFDLAEVAGVGVVAAGSLLEGPTGYYPAQLWFSPDYGDTWEKVISRQSSPGVVERFYLAYAAGGKFHAVYAGSSPDRYFTSSDGRNWTEQPFPYFSNQNDLEVSFSYGYAREWNNGALILHDLSNIGSSDTPLFSYFDGTDYRLIFPNSNPEEYPSSIDEWQSRNQLDRALPTRKTGDPGVPGVSTMVTGYAGLAIGDDGYPYVLTSSYNQNFDATFNLFGDIWRVNPFTNDFTHVAELPSRPSSNFFYDTYTGLEVYDGRAYVGGMGGRFYIAELQQNPWTSIAEGVTGPAGPMGPQGATGPNSIHMASVRSPELVGVGEWSPTASYRPGMIVRHAGQSWVAARPSTNRVPGSSLAVTDHFLHPINTYINGASSVLVPGENWWSDGLRVAAQGLVPGTILDDRHLELDVGTRNPSISARCLVTPEHLDANSNFVGQLFRISLGVRYPAPNVNEDLWGRAANRTGVVVYVEQYVNGGNPAELELYFWLQWPGVPSDLTIHERDMSNENWFNAPTDLYAAAGFAYTEVGWRIHPVEVPYANSVTASLINLAPDRFACYLDDRKLMEFSVAQPSRPGDDTHIVVAEDSYPRSARSAITSVSLGEMPYWERIA